MKDIKRRKKLIFAAAALLVLSAVIVYAYLTVNRTKTNKLRIGYNDTVVVEDYNPFSMKVGINYFKKKVQVKNTGNTDCYVRVYVDFTDDTIRHSSFLAYADGTEETAFDNLLGSSKSLIFTLDPSNNYQPVSGSETLGNVMSKLTFYSAVHSLSMTDDEKTAVGALKTETNGEAGSEVTVTHSDIDTENTYAYKVNNDDSIGPDWVFVEDDETLGGYYYYTKPLEPGGETTPLFTYIKTIMKQKTSFNILVYSESVQTVKSNGKDTTKETGENWETMWRDFLTSTP